MGLFDSFEKIGFSTYFTSQLADDDLECFTVARIIEEHKGIYKLKGDGFERLGKISGRFQYLYTDPSEYPTVGDFVLIRNDSDRKMKNHSI